MASFGKIAKLNCGSGRIADLRAIDSHKLRTSDCLPTWITVPPPAIRIRIVFRARWPVRQLCHGVPRQRVTNDPQLQPADVLLGQLFDAVKSAQQCSGVGRCSPAPGVIGGRDRVEELLRLMRVARGSRTNAERSLRGTSSPLMLHSWGQIDVAP